MDLIEKLEAYRIARGLKRVDMARIFGVDQQRYNNWVYRNSLPKQFYPKAQALLKAAGNTDIAENVAPYHGSVGKLPLISFVRAGNWDEVMNPYELQDAEAWLASPIPHSDRAFLLRNKGISMFNPRTGEGYPDGCILQIDPEVEVKNGSDVIIRTPDGGVTFKQLSMSHEGNYLHAINPDWPESIIKIPEDSVICGVCTGYWVEKLR